MPSHYELHFGYPNLERACDFIGRKGWNLKGLYEGDEEDKEMFFQDAETMRNTPAIVDMVFDLVTGNDDIEALLGNAWLDSIKEVGWFVKGESQNNYTILDTPYGLRESPGWSMCVQFDPDEIYDSIEELSVGVNLTSRYFPSYLDMKDRHGTIPLIFDDEMNHRIHIAQKNIIKYVPEMQNAVLFVRDIFY